MSLTLLLVFDMPDAVGEVDLLCDMNGSTESMSMHSRDTGREGIDGMRIRVKGIGSTAGTDELRTASGEGPPVNLIAGGGSCG